MSTYREAGVDLDAAEALVDDITGSVTASWGSDVVGSFGGFAAGIRIPPGYAAPVLMMSTDGVGTKADVARAAGLLDGLGSDLVAMCIDDLAAAGARPIAMTDYLVVGSLQGDTANRLIASVAAACATAGVALLGGETAVHAGVVEDDAFDLAGAALGVVEDGRQVDGSRIRPGDSVVAIGSPNLRSNGFSLIRSAILPEAVLGAPFPLSDETIAEVLLAPSVVYAPAITAVLAAIDVHGLVHVTGGGIEGNLARVLPAVTAAHIDRSTWNPPAVFRFVQEVGRIGDDEMFRVFNMGIGFLVICDPGDTGPVIDSLGDHGHTAWVCGQISEAGDTPGR